MRWDLLCSNRPGRWIPFSPRVWDTGSSPLLHSLLSTCSRPFTSGSSICDAEVFRLNKGMRQSWWNNSGPFSPGGSNMGTSFLSSYTCYTAFCYLNKGVKHWQWFNSTFVKVTCLLRDRIAAKTMFHIIWKM